MDLERIYGFGTYIIYIWNGIFDILKYLTEIYLEFPFRFRSCDKPSFAFFFQFLNAQAPVTSHINQRDISARFARPIKTLFRRSKRASIKFPITQ